MPELPDVVGSQKYLEATALHQRIAKTSVFDERILGEVSTRALARRLNGNALEETARHGKYLFASLTGGGWLVLHFGMTGGLGYYGESGAPPEYARVVLDFDNGFHFAYINQRVLGRVDVADDLDSFIEQENLGPDALSPALDRAAFCERLQQRRGPIKSRLMDQSLVAGIGNVYSDEILFQVGFHPATPVSDLGDDDLARLYRTMRRVLRVASEHNGHVEEFPRGYFLPHRGEDGACPKCGGPLRSVKVTGRTAYFCPQRQMKPR